MTTIRGEGGGGQLPQPMRGGGLPSRNVRGYECSTKYVLNTKYVLVQIYPI